MIRRRRNSLIAAPLGVVAAFMLAATGLAAEPTIEAVSYPGLAWSPSSVTVTAGESVTFKNTDSLPHGVNWTGGTPSCTGVPGSGQTSWTGSCTFAQAGSYPFVCPVHPSMTGNVNVNGGGPEAPVVSTGGGTPTSDTEATLQGTVNPNGLSTEYFFKYGTTTSYGQTTGKQSAGAGTSAVPASAGLTGLSPATIYHLQLVAENSSGTTQGTDRTFTTPGPPLATSGTVVAIGDTGATLQGSVNPRGHETTYYFDYGMSTGYGQKTAAKSAGTGTAPQSVSAILAGLSPETTYHYRLVAENSSGEASGADHTFVTSSTPPPPPPPPPQTTLPAPSLPLPAPLPLPSNELETTAAGVAQVKGGKALVRMRCGGAASCKGVVKLLVRVKERRAAKRSGRRRSAKRARNVVIGKSRFSIPTGRSKTIHVKLTGKGKRLLRNARHHRLRVRLAGPGVKRRTVLLKQK